MQSRLPASRLPFVLSNPEALVLRTASTQHESARLVMASLDPRSKSADVRMLLRAYYETASEGQLGVFPLVRGTLKGKLDSACKEALSRDPSYAKSLAERAAESRKRNPPVFEKKQGRTVRRGVKPPPAPNPNIRVTRDAYCVPPHQRKPFTRADGTHVQGGKVAGHCVPQTTFLTPDQGKPGRSAYGAKAGPHSQAKGYRPWISTEGTLGEGFLTTMSSADRHKAIDHAVKQHGYRSVLGKISALQRSYVLRQKYGAALEDAHSYIVKKYGGSGSFGPRSNKQSNFGATLEERQRVMNRLKR
jgi:hypothetical protein